MIQSEQINELAAALAKAQSEMGRAVKDSNNPFFKSKYADLSSVWDACQAALNSNGLAVAQILSSNDAGQPVLLTTLMHTSGQWLRSSALIPLLKPDPQTMGSAITYMRRYSLAALVGVVQEDDDGEKAQARDKITNDQANELINLIGNDMEYGQQVMASLRGQGIQGFQMIPLHMFQKIRDAIIKHKAEKKSQNVA